MIIENWRSSGAFGGEKCGRRRVVRSRGRSRQGDLALGVALRASDDGPLLSGLTNRDMLQKLAGHVGTIQMQYKDGTTGGPHRPRNSQTSHGGRADHPGRLMPSPARSGRR